MLSHSLPLAALHFLCVMFWFALSLPARDPARTVVAFALAFSNYSTFLATPGLWLEDLYVREPYRRFGMGTLLLRYLTRVAYGHVSGVLWVRCVGRAPQQNRMKCFR